MARGGRRTPAKPAPVSGPGAMSQRTDGGASQPIRVAGDQPYGARKASTEAQGAAPLAAGGGAPPGVGAAGTGGGASPMPPLDVFGPTSRPNEPATAGLDRSGLVSPDDPDMMLRMIYEQFPHPSIARLIQ